MAPLRQRGNEVIKGVVVAVAVAVVGGGGGGGRGYHQHALWTNERTNSHVVSGVVSLSVSLFVNLSLCLCLSLSDYVSNCFFSILSKTICQSTYLRMSVLSKYVLFQSFLS